ncbi:MAG: amidase family protein, partial [Burkholderiaceae bacterium]
MAQQTLKENIMYKQSFSSAAASIFATALMVASSAYADHHAAGSDTLTAAKAAADICAGKVKSESLVAESLSRAKALSELNAFITLDEGGAISAAKQVDAARKSGARCKPLEGVPIVIKDNIEVVGLPSTAGTKALMTYVPKADAPV